MKRYVYKANNTSQECEVLTFTEWTGDTPDEMVHAMFNEGKIERTLHGHLTGHPDEAFSTDELCPVCYGLSGV